MASTSASHRCCSAGICALSSAARSWGAGTAEGRRLEQPQGWTSLAAKTGAAQTASEKLGNLPAKGCRGRTVRLGPEASGVRPSLPGSP
jgi:hypothetical protein